MRHASQPIEHNAAPVPQDVAHLSRQYLTFTLGAEEYGVDIMMIREVKGWSETTRLPNSPPYIRGVLNLRGIIIPIFDLRARLSGDITPATEKHVIVIIATQQRTIGLLVDTVSDILTINSAEIKALPDQHSDSNKRYVNGLIAVDKRMVVLLDVGCLLKDDLGSCDALVEGMADGGGNE